MEQEAINQRGGSRRGEGEAPAALWAGTAAGGAQRRETGSRGLLLTKAAIGAGAGIARGITGAAFAGAAGCDYSGIEQQLGLGYSAIGPSRDLDRQRQGRLTLPVGNLVDGVVGLFELRRSLGDGQASGLDVVEQLHLGNMPNMGTSCNTKNAQPVLYPKAAHQGHKVPMSNNRIADLRKAKGMTQDQLADAIGTTVNNLGKLERGARRLNEDWINKIAAALGCDPSEILAKAPSERPRDMPLDMRRAPEQMPTRNAHADAGPAKLRRVNLQLAMGDGTNLEDWFEEEPVDFDMGWLRTITSTPTNRLIVGSGVGDSMAPTIGDRDDVMINLDENRLTKLDGIYAITIEGAGAIKRLMPGRDKTIEVLSDNPAHPNRVRNYPREAIDIIGRIIWSGRQH